MSDWSFSSTQTRSRHAGKPAQPRRRFVTVLAVLGALSLVACSDNPPAPSSPRSAPESTSQTAAPETRKAIEETARAQPAIDAKQAFWTSLQTLCDKRFGGQLTIGTEESDRTFGLADMTMYSKRCSRNAIDIGFKVDDDDSRTWMFRRTNAGLSLHHRHVDESGKEDATSGYGGISATPGTAERQEFPADANTGSMIPAAATNIWAIEIVPGEKFAYELQRIEEQRMFRVVFDLTQPLP